MGRLQFQAKLRTLAPKAWYQKPPENKMTYPCFVYKNATPTVIRADNRAYLFVPRYEVLYISQTENEQIEEEMVNTFPHCDVGRHYISDQLHHYVFTVSYK